MPSEAKYVSPDEAVKKINTSAEIESRAADLVKTGHAKYPKTKQISSFVISTSIDAVSQGDEFDELKDYKNKFSSVNNAVKNVKRLKNIIQTKKTQQVANSIRAAENSIKVANLSQASATTTASAGGTTAVSTVSATAGLPVIFIVILAFLGLALIITIFGIFTSLMSTNNNTGGLSGVEKEIAEALIAEGYNKIHVAAIMGNMSCESSFNSRALESGGEYDYLDGDLRTNGQGYGLNQMTNGRKNNMCTLADSRHSTHSDIKIQVAYFNSAAEKSESNWNKSLWQYYDCVPMSRNEWERLDDNLDLLTTALMAFWERPSFDPGINHIEKRKSEAQRIFATLSSQGGDGSIVGESQAIADDDTHGYSQINRELNPDCDCSSFVFYSLQHAGYGLSGPAFNTSTMRDFLIPLGFQEIAYTGLSICQQGDILWNAGHTEVYAGEGQSIGAHDDYDGMSGDSTGREVNKASADQAWVLIYRPPLK